MRIVSHQLLLKQLRGPWLFYKKFLTNLHVVCCLNPSIVTALTVIVLLKRNLSKSASIITSNLLFTCVSCVSQQVLPVRGVRGGRGCGEAAEVAGPPAEPGREDLPLQPLLPQEHGVQRHARLGRPRSGNHTTPPNLYNRPIWLLIPTSKVLVRVLKIDIDFNLGE